LPALEATYARFIKEHIHYPDLVYRKKKQVMDTLLAVEMRTLGRYLSVLAAGDRYARELSREELTRALVETTACLAPYRTYIRGFEVTAQERLPIDHALQEAQRRNPSIKPACFQFLREVFLLQSGPHLLPEQRESRLAFVMTWQQFTGPITAKGVEDSALYVYNRLISLNEVGSSPQHTDLSMSGFHRFMQRRHQKWPFAMNATMTHDAKRAEDVRARISVLSELPEEWENCLTTWSQWNHSKCQQVRGVRAPERNEETLLYQTLLGSWPVAEAACACYTRRIQEFMVKAVREAMVHTRWTVPNLDHEQALMNFVGAILQESPDNRFLKDFKRFAAKIAYHGALNSLSQLVIKLGSPGVADLYQGTELWDLRLVDPDNRQRVDFSKRKEFLANIADTHQCLSEFVTNWEDGRIKMYVTQRGLRFRRNNAALFLKGTYVPLAVDGPRQDCVIAFARRYRGDWSMVIVPRFTTQLVAYDNESCGHLAWGPTCVLLPKEAPKRWINFLGDQKVEVTESGEIHLNEALQSLPVALLSSRN
jgi:(1->4)-alpha-D-glucan 1-alpha-D-glucosylmutase